MQHATGVPRYADAKHPKLPDGKFGLNMYLAYTLPASPKF